MAESIWDCRVSSVDWICASCASDADDKSVFAGGTDSRQCWPWQRGICGKA